MKLTDEERKFAVSERVGIYPGPRYVTEPSSGSHCFGGWETLIVRGADIVARGRGDTRESAFQSARRAFEKFIQHELNPRIAR
jgi:hypothetical protein